MNTASPLQPLLNSKKAQTVYVTAHCLLNPLSRVKGIRVPNPFPTFEKAVIQLPCPELIFAGKDRDKKAKEDYEIPEYRQLCRDLFLPFADMIESLSKGGHEIQVIGVPKSPSCGVLTTSVRESGGEEPAAENKAVCGKGIFMEEIENELNRRQIAFQMIE